MTAAVIIAVACLSPLYDDVRGVMYKSDIHECLWDAILRNVVGYTISYLSANVRAEGATAVSYILDL